METPIVISNPLVQRDFIVSPTTAPVTEFSFEHPAAIRQSDMSRTRGEIPTPSPADPPVGVRQARVQIQFRAMQMAVHVPARGHQDGVPFQTDVVRAGVEVPCRESCHGVSETWGTHRCGIAYSFNGGGVGGAYHDASSCEMSPSLKSWNCWMSRSGVAGDVAARGVWASCLSCVSSSRRLQPCCLLFRRQCHLKFRGPFARTGTIVS